jgi:hypothetical protein
MVNEILELLRGQPCLLGYGVDRARWYLPLVSDDGHIPLPSAEESPQATMTSLLPDELET